MKDEIDCLSVVHFAIATTFSAYPESRRDGRLQPRLLRRGKGPNQNCGVPEGRSQRAWIWGKSAVVPMGLGTFPRRNPALKGGAKRQFLREFADRKYVAAFSIRVLSFLMSLTSLNL